jgi:hypothetical protein
MAGKVARLRHRRSSQVVFLYRQRPLGSACRHGCNRPRRHIHNRARVRRGGAAPSNSAAAWSLNRHTIWRRPGLGLGGQWHPGPDARMPLSPAGADSDSEPRASGRGPGTEAGVANYLPLQGLPDRRGKPLNRLENGLRGKLGQGSDSDPLSATRASRLSALKNAAEASRGLP